MLAAPLVAALALAVSGALYPVILPGLAAGDLVLGRFVAGLLLLGVPLAALAAMGPMLIGLPRGTEAGPASRGASSSWLHSSRRYATVPRGWAYQPGSA